VTIILTALGVMLAILAIMIAILAIWGYASILRQAKKASINEVEKSVKKAIEDQFTLESLKETIQTIVDEKLDAGLDMADAYIEDKLSSGGITEKPVAEKYPEIKE
jgi:predicted membrane protein